MARKGTARKRIKYLISAAFDELILYLSEHPNGLAIWLTCLFTAVATAGAVAAHAAPPILSTLTLTFGDEFSGTSLDAGHWAGWVSNYTTPSTINNELQAYTPDALVFDTTDGILRLRADKRSYGSMSYTSGAITTFAKFHQTYGYFVMRAKLPVGQGLWPAFWLLPSNGKWPPELDVMENIGNDPSTVFMSNRWPGGKHSQSSRGQIFPKAIIHLPWNGTLTF
jgi:beta-glucanase (GH16 family)